MAKEGSRLANAEFAFQSFYKGGGAELDKDKEGAKSEK